MMNRRQFLKSTAFTALGAAALSSDLAWGDPLGLPIGIQLYTVGDAMTKDAPATIKKIAEIGYREVETAGFGSVNTASALRKVLDDNGLKCPSAHLSFNLKNLNKAFDDAHALGCTYATASVPRFLIMDDMVSPADVPPEQRGAAMQKMIAGISAPMSSDELKKLIDAMNQAGDAAKQQGLKLASHNHTFEFQMIDGEPEIYHLIANTDPNNVKFEIDCGWAELAGYNPVDVVNRFPGRIKMLHVKDFLHFEKGAGRATGTELGKGVLDYKEIFAGVKGKGIEHIFVEQEPPFTEMPAIQAAEVDFKYLHSLS
jgi:sugar phosphate isomerase/epimerase